METKDYNIYAGLGGGFGGARYQGTIRNVTEEEACDYASDAGDEKYASYSGMYGLANWDDFIEDNPEGTEEEYDEYVEQDKEMWIECYAIPTEEDDEIDESEIEYLD